MARMKLWSSGNESDDLEFENQRIPSWSSFNSATTVDLRGIQHVGYLPIIPAPATEASTIYTCLCNLKDVLDQLQQEYLPVTCDEGVYRIARPIVMSNPKEFEKIILCLGDFHITKVIHACIAKYLQESGVRDVLIETNLFGMNVVDQILSGSHYARWTKAFTYLAEALRRLQLRDFFTESRRKKFESEILTLHSLEDSFETKNFDECKYLVREFKNIFENLLTEFNVFVTMRS